MKIHVTVFGALALSIIPLAAQNPPVRYAQSACLKVQPGKDAEYLKFRDTVSKRTAQIRADAHEFAFQLFLRAAYPAGAEATCDYLVVSIHPGFPPDPKTRMPSETVFSKAQVSMQQSEFVAARDALVRLRKVELWRLLDAIGTPEPGNYLSQDYMKVQPANFADWLKMEQETYKPVHQARIELGALKGWALTTLMLPRGSALPYNAMTVNIHKDWASVANATKYTEAFAKTGKNFQETGQQAAKLRDLVRSDLYEVVDVIRPAATSTASNR